MENVLTAILGVLLGSLLTMWWQQRNWQTQEAMKAYSQLFPTGKREITLCGSIEYGANMGDDEFIRLASQQQPSLIDSPFLRALTQCWLLETDSGIRFDLDKIEEQYEMCRLKVRGAIEDWQIQKALSVSTDAKESEQLQQRRDRLEARQEGRANPEDLEQLFCQLKQKVGSRYFHNWRFWRILGC